MVSSSEVIREATAKDPCPQSIGDRMYHDLGEVKGKHVFLTLSKMGGGGWVPRNKPCKRPLPLCPSAVIMVGIAFGVNRQEQAIGDIPVSRQLWLSDLQRNGKQPSWGRAMNAKFVKPAAIGLGLLLHTPIQIESVSDFLAQANLPTSKFTLDYLYLAVHNPHVIPSPVV